MRSSYAYISFKICDLDVQQTYQIGSSGSGSPLDNGYNLLVAPMTTEEVLNVKTCFLVNGTSDAPVRPQSIFPDLTGFQVGFIMLYFLFESNPLPHGFRCARPKQLKLGM